MEKWTDMWNHESHSQLLSGFCQCHNIMSHLSGERASFPKRDNNAHLKMEWRLRRWRDVARQKPAPYSTTVPSEAQKTHGHSMAFTLFHIHEKLLIPLISSNFGNFLDDLMGFRTVQESSPLSPASATVAPGPSEGRSSIGGCSNAIFEHQRVSFDSFFGAILEGLLFKPRIAQVWGTTLWYKLCRVIKEYQAVPRNGSKTGIATENHHISPCYHIPCVQCV